MRLLSMLRGVNVSSKNKIVMADLKRLYESLGLTNVVTYIQSGNVAFNVPPHSDIEAWGDTLEQAIAKRHKIYTPVLLRTRAEMERALTCCPFEEVDPGRDGSRILVVFFRHLPAAEGLRQAQAQAKPHERVALQGSEAYLFCPDGHGRSKLSNAWLEKQFRSAATTRNLNTTRRLCTLLQ